MNRSSVMRGWREIAAYMDCSISTAYRLHRNFGLPIVRTLSKRVFTTVSAIDAWILQVAAAERELRGERTLNGH